MHTRESRSRRRAEHDFVERHLPLVHYAVAEIANRIPAHVSRDDLAAAGMCGLVQAAQVWEAERGIPFDRFAARRIRGAILDELRSIDWATRSVRARSREVRAAQESLTATLGHTPTTTEVGQHLGLATDEVKKVETDVHRAVVLNYEGLAAVDSAESRLPEDGRSPEALLLDREQIALLRDAIAVLPERLRRVVVGYFYEELPMRDLAEELDVTESRISQMRAEALTLLKSAMQAQLEPEVAPEEPATRSGKKRMAYYAEVAAHRSFRSRLDDTAYAVPSAPATQVRIAG